MKYDLSFRATVEKFPGIGGWLHVTIPKKFQNDLKTKRKKAWGMYPVVANSGTSTWNTKLMMKKGGIFFVALKSAVRKKEQIEVGDNITVSIKLI